MTREAKIGMLTGLGVIVLVGALLSEYLGGPANQMQSASAMPDLSSEYRAVQQRPVGSAGVRTQGGEVPDRVSMLPGGGELPAAFNGERAHVRETPVTVISPPIMPEAMPPGPEVAMTRTDGPTVDITPVRSSDPSPMIFVTPADARRMVPLERSDVASRVDVGGIASAPEGKLVEIVKGDTLERLARKHYGSGSRANIERIVKANPSILKDVSTPLVIGKKLMLPLAPGMAATAAPAPTAPRAVAGGSGAVPMPRATIVAPGAGDRREAASAAPAPATRPGTAVEAPKVATYTVVKGDTLERIARKLMGTASRDAVQKLMTVNGIKDPTALRIGTVLRIPQAAVAGDASRTRG